MSAKHSTGVPLDGDNGLPFAEVSFPQCEAPPPLLDGDRRMGPSQP